MAHLIENGWTFQANNEPAWHKLGITFPSAVDPDMAWTALGEPIVVEYRVQAIIDANNTVDCKLVKVLFRISKNPDGTPHITELAHVNPSYTVVQPRTITHQWDELINTGLVELETGGWLENRIYWSQARLTPAIAEVVPGDVIRNRILLTAGFDGQIPIEMNDALERTVCANTMAVAKCQAKGLHIKLRHTASVHDRLEQANMLIQAKIEAFKENVEAYRQLAKVKLTSQNMKDYFWRVFAPEATTQADRDERPRIASKVSHVIDLMDAPEYVPAVRGTAWHTYNAVSHYLSHDATDDDSRRLKSLWFGQGAMLNQRAMDQALALAN